jgi:serine/threonine-protein kinase RsbW
VTDQLKRMPPVQIEGPAAKIGPAVEMVRRFAVAEGLPSAAADALSVALDEAISNVVRYAYDAREPVLTIEATADSDGVEVVLSDGGRPFNPLDWPAPSLDGDAADRPVGGLGIHLMRSLVDRLDYRREGNCNRLMLRKQRAVALARDDAGGKDGADSAGA